MRFIASVLLTVAAAAALDTGAAAAVIDVPVTPLIIRLYASEALDEPARAAALREAGTILASAGLGAGWVICDQVLGAGGPCAVPMHGAELAVRIVPAPGRRQADGRQALGYSLIDAKTKAGALATVFLDRVMWLAAAAGADYAPLLGRAIAHEIGHLLLGTVEHARAGVMRAVWSRALVRDNRAGQWRFAAPEARRMRAAVSARSVVTQLARN